MTKISAKPNSTGTLSRCLHRYASGRRCRSILSDSSSYFCERHLHLQPPTPDSVNLSPDLVGQLSQFTSAADINRVLSRLLTLLAQNRVSPRRAAVIAYISSLLLHTLPAIEHELHPEDDEDVRVIWDMPRPKRDGPVEGGLPAVAGEPVTQTP